MAEVETDASATATDLDEKKSGGSLQAAILVLTLAAGFALVPRFVSSCGAPSGTEDAPDFSAHVVANKAVLGGEDQVKLSAFRGHPVILDFWATWCGPCQAEAPIVNSIAERYREKGLVVVGVNTSDAAGLAEKFVAKKGIGFPMVFDADNDIARQYRVDNLPTLIVVSKDGKIVATRHGITSDADLESLVKRVL